MTLPQPPPQPTYDRDSVVTAVCDFYAFLTRIPRWTAADFQDAPPGGWPQLTDELLAPLGKDAAVRDLLRHLPYLVLVYETEDDWDNDDRYADEDGIDGAGTCGDKTMIVPETRTIDYPGESTRWCLASGAINGNLAPYGAGVVPSHVAVLTSGLPYGSWLLVDTQQGTATDYIQMDHPERPDPGEDSPDRWRAYRTLPVAEMLAEWEDKYRQLEWVVVPDNADDGVMYRMNAETDQVRDIYRHHGWPDNFRQEDCRQALTQWYKEQRRRLAAAYQANY